jgi:hypothetical protein
VSGASLSPCGGGPWASNQIKRRTKLSSIKQQLITPQLSPSHWVCLPCWHLHPLRDVDPGLPLELRPNSPKGAIDGLPMRQGTVLPFMFDRAKSKFHSIQIFIPLSSEFEDKVLAENRGVRPS